MTSPRIATVLVAGAIALGGAAAQAHSPRMPDPFAALDAPGLAPARSLMRRVMPAGPAPIFIEPEIATRGMLPFFFFRWFGAPDPAPHGTSRCERVFTPYGGSVETCTTHHRRPMPRPMRVYDDWLESR